MQANEGRFITTSEMQDIVKEERERKVIASKELPRLVKNLGLAGINRQAYDIGM